MYILWVLTYTRHNLHSCYKKITLAALREGGDGGGARRAWRGCGRSVGDRRVTWPRAVVQSGQVELTRAADELHVKNEGEESRVVSKFSLGVLGRIVAKIGKHWGGVGGGEQEFDFEHISFEIQRDIVDGMEYVSGISGSSELKCAFGVVSVSTVDYGTG